VRGSGDHALFPLRAVIVPADARTRPPPDRTAAIAFRIRLVELALKGEGEMTGRVRRDVEILPGPCHIVGYGSVPAL
jgi:hypothetical protein